MAKLDSSDLNESEKGWELERIFFNAYITHFIHAVTSTPPVSFINGITNELLHLQIPLNSNVCRFPETFPNFTDYGLYWSSSSRYPVCKGFVYTENMLIGIQCTITAPSKRKPIDFNDSEIKALLLKIIRFCTANQLGFAILYVVRDNIVSTYSEEFNLLDIDDLVFQNITLSGFV